MQFQLDSTEISSDIDNFTKCFTKCPGNLNQHVKTENFYSFFFFFFFFFLQPLLNPCLRVTSLYLHLTGGSWTPERKEMLTENWGRAGKNETPIATGWFSGKTKSSLISLIRAFQVRKKNPTFLSVKTIYNKIEIECYRSICCL